MKPKPSLRSSKAPFVLANLDTNMPEKGKLMIMYLDGIMAIKESECSLEWIKWINIQLDI
jgi:hypothetical protein